MRPLFQKIAMAGPVWMLAACQPDPPAIQDKPDTPPDPVDTDVSVPLRQPDIEVEPATLPFGGRPPGCPSPPQTVTVRNVGNNPLQITSITLGGQDAAAYEIVGDTPETVRAGQEATFEVRFNPGAYLAYDKARVIIASNDPDEAQVNVPATGEGSQAVTAEDAFLQQNASAVDVLFVLDQSGSMGDTIGRLRNAMSTFVNSFVNLGLDYRLAITTTALDEPMDSGMPVSLYGAEGWFVDDWMDESRNGNPTGVTNEFKRQVNLVLNDIGESTTANNEKGLGAAKAALSAPNVNQAPNAGFLRPDAKLAVAVVSDEDDVTGGLTANAFVTWFAGLKGGDFDEISFSGLVGPQGSTCGSFPNIVGAAPRYHAAINQTGGVWANICQFDVQTFLQFLSYVAAGLEINFELDETPLQGASPAQAFTVQVCDAQGACQNVPYSVTDGWTYDAATNEVQTHGSWIPDPGETIIVTYPVDGDCPT